MFLISHGKDGWDISKARMRSEMLRPKAFLLENLKERNTWKDTDVDERLKSRWILKKYSEGFEMD